MSRKSAYYSDPKHRAPKGDLAYARKHRRSRKLAKAARLDRLGVGKIIS